MFKRRPKRRGSSSTPGAGGTLSLSAAAAGTAATATTGSDADASSTTTTGLGGGGSSSSAQKIPSPLPSPRLKSALRKSSHLPSPSPHLSGTRSLPPPSSIPMEWTPVLPTSCSFCNPDTDTHATTSSNASSSVRRPRKNVRFDTVSVREFERVLGDNPSCSSGAPIGIGWAHADDRTIPVDDYERTQQHRRRDQLDLVLTRQDREALLLEWGASFHQIIDAIRANVKAKNQRRRTVNSIGTYDRWEEVIEKAGRKIKRTLLLQKPTRMYEDSSNSSHSFKYNSQTDASSPIDTNDNAVMNEPNKTSLDAPPRSISRRSTPSIIDDNSDDNLGSNIHRAAAIVQKMAALTELSESVAQGETLESMGLDVIDNHGHRGLLRVNDQRRGSNDGVPLPMIEVVRASNSAPVYHPEISMSSFHSLLSQDTEAYLREEEAYGVYSTFSTMASRINSLNHQQFSATQEKEQQHARRRRCHNDDDGFENLVREHAHWDVATNTSGPDVVRRMMPVVIHEEPPPSSGAAPPFHDDNDDMYHDMNMMHFVPYDPRIHGALPLPMQKDHHLPPGFMMQPPPGSNNIISKWE